MSPFASPLFAAAGLLLIAGAVKLLSPAATRIALRSAGLPNQAWTTRLLGVIEIVIAASALIVGGALPAALVSLTYLGFGGFVALLAHRTRHTAPCGCFGASSAPVGAIHITMNLIAAALAGAAALDPTGGMAQAATDTPWAGLPFYALTALLTWTAYVSLTLLPELQAAMKTNGAAT